MRAVRGTTLPGAFRDTHPGRSTHRSVARNSNSRTKFLPAQSHLQLNARARTTTYQLKPTICTTPPRSVRASALSPVQEEALLLEHEKTFTYGKEFTMAVKITEAANGEQKVYIETNYPSSSLILHWGVQGGRSYTGGWRLPDSRPKDTVQYKDRALQTCFMLGQQRARYSARQDAYCSAPCRGESCFTYLVSKDAGGDKKVINMVLPADDAADYLNFVLKDAATNTWYDSNGSNFQLALRTSLRSFMSMDDAEFGPALSLDEIPEIPANMAGIWAYIMWEHAGCPNRSSEEADREYQQGISELQQCLCRGKTLSELWKVANGEVPYGQFKREFIDVGKEAETEAMRIVDSLEGGSAPKEDLNVKHTVEIEEVWVPDDLMAVQAYILWEKAGKPDGADYAQAARNEIHRQLKSGKKLEEIEALLRTPAPAPPPPVPKKDEKAQPKSEGKSGGKEEVQQAPPSTPPPTPGHKVEVGTSLENMPSADPLKLIKSATVPLLSGEKRKKQATPLEFLVQAAAVDESTRFRRLFKLPDGEDLLVVVSGGAPPEENGAVAGSPLQVAITTSSPNDLVLHWGVSKQNDHSWMLPPKSLWSGVKGSVADAGGQAIETPFRPRVAADDEPAPSTKLPLQELKFSMPCDGDMSSLVFVVRSADRSAWYRDGSKNFMIPLQWRRAEAASDAEPMDSLLMHIVDAENSDKWTLMHRFGAAAGVLDEMMQGVHTDVARAAAAVYVWLRYSATRALTWQRSYNTQPRQLSSAQAHLVGTIANAHGNTSGETQEWVRLMLATVGRGGDGQAIRDEILHIMHRNHIPELKGTWMEEWHQKLHNNTTPDDVPICKAYLAFLRSNGDNGAYWRVLSDAGLTRARLESFDRPIRQEPQDYPDRRGALIRDFENYLGILKAVHSGADLQASAKNAGHCMPPGAKGHLGYVLASVGSNQVLPLVQSAVACRLELHASMPGNKDLLYLDLALENVVRAAVERGIGSLGIGAAAFVGPLLQNLVLSAGDNEEMCYCLKAWQALPRSVQFGAQPSTVEALQATAVVDRIRRALGQISTSTTDRIQPLAQAIGENCGVERWTIDLFAEEVVRGGPAFGVSLVLATVEPALRRCADLGSWQIISPADVIGRVVEVAALDDVQDKVYEEPTILLAKHVSGEEEIPENAVAVVTPDAPDILSHSSVRARNMKVLFVTCHNKEPLEEMRDYVGQLLSIQTTAAGNVTWALAEDSQLSNNGSGGSSTPSSRPSLKMDIPDWCGKWAVPMADYADGVVGAKSKNLAALRGKLPEWIALPASVTLPFCCFEEALEAPANEAVRKSLLNAAKRVSDSPAKHLYECREAVKSMTLPAVLREQLSAQMEAAGIPLPESEARWLQAERAIIGVWASKFNDRAYFSMRKVGLDFMHLRMAVLVQRVVPAEYAFVIHTVNPSSGNEDEIYCELVKGLGESLVSGTVPGSALSFVAPKTDPKNAEVKTFPSKSHGMFVPESLIFRSDSNGEDLAGYAGAGLYESITMDPSTLDIVDFSADPIMNDQNFRKELLGRICEVGLAIEQAMDSPQDIEGVVGPDGSITVVQTRPQV